MWRRIVSSFFEEKDAPPPRRRRRRPYSSISSFEENEIFFPLFKEEAFSCSFKEKKISSTSFEKKEVFCSSYSPVLVLSFHGMTEQMANSAGSHKEHERGAMTVAGLNVRR